MEEASIPIINFVDRISPIQDLGLLVSRVAQAGLILATLAFFLYFIRGGIKWIMAGSDAAQLDEAKNELSNALMGLTVTAAAWAIFILVDHFLGLGVALGGSAGGAGSGLSSSGAGQCGGGLAIGETGTLGGTTYQCVAAGTPCGSGNPTGYSYPFNCPVSCVNTTSVSCN